MGDIEHHGRSREVVTELISLAQEVSSLAQECETERQVFNEFAILIDKFLPILNGLRENYEIMEHPPVQKAIESLGKEFSQAKGLVTNPGSKTLAKQLENLVHELGRSIGLLLFASLELCVDLKDKIGALHRDLMSSRLDPSSVASSSRHSEIVREFDAEEQEQEGEIRMEKIGLDADDVVLKLKHGDEEEIKPAILGLGELIEEKRVESDWIENEGVIPALFSRLGSSKSEYRLIMIHLLRTLVLDNPKHKEKMAEVGFLSTLVRSLTREEEERREAVGLLLGLSELSSVRRRIGRIQGCIVMLVALLNGDDLIASRDAGKLLNCLSSNTQNALHMAEAGYFKPIVQYLKEGSDMSKILMATALSRMELTDQNKASLGEDGAIKPLARMFASGKLEAKASALNALQNLSGPPENARRLARSGILPPLLQLLFSVTSALTALREPASAVLAQIAGSEAVVINPGIAQQMLSLLSLSSPVVRTHLLRGLNSIAVNPGTLKVRQKMKESCAVRIILPFLTETNCEVRESALALLHTLCQDLSEELSEQIGEADIGTLLGIVMSSKSDSEKADSLGILSCFPESDKRVAEIFKREKLLSAVISTLSRAKTEVERLEEGTAGVLVRLTTPSDRKLQLYSVENGVVPLLVRLLSSESVPAKTRAATSLAQLSRNSILPSAAPPGWFCGVPAPVGASCEVHGKNCSAKGSFCLVKAGAVPGLLRIIEGGDRGADEAALGALATLLRDEIWESGCNFATKMPGFFQAVLRALGPGTATGAREKALWILERVFRVEEHRVKYGKPAQAVLIDLAHHGDSRLKPMIAKVLAQLELLQLQSSYF